MPTVNSAIFGDSNFMNLKAVTEGEIRQEVYALLVSREEIVCAYKTIRDQVIFTNRRILVVNVQGLVGKKVGYFSYPYSKVQFYGVQTAGLLDIDSELMLSFSNGALLTFDFKAKVDIRKLCAIISEYIL